MAKEFAKKFYNSAKWKQCRLVYIESVHGLCERCLAKGQYVPGYIVHHKIMLTPENINDPEITLNHENLEYVCKMCHDKEHDYDMHYNKQKNRRDTREGMRFDANGQLIKGNTIIVYGAPASGKTTYVKEHMKTGDMVVDLDSIKQAISYCDKTATPDNLYNVAVQIRNTLYEIIASGTYDSDNVWVVAGLPHKEERQALQKKLKAELVFINTDKKTCISRANQDIERTDKDLQKRIIEKWYEHYEP